MKFSGKGSNFYEWKVKTLALFRKKNFALYLKEDRQKVSDFDRGKKCVGSASTELNLCTV